MVNVGYLLPEFAKMRVPGHDSLVKNMRPCEIQWREFRHRRIKFFLAGGIGFAILVVGAKYSIALDSPSPLAIASIVALAILGIFGIPYLRWPCPRCGKAFISKGPFGLIYRNPFARHCVHCNFPVGAYLNGGTASEG